MAARVSKKYPPKLMAELTLQVHFHPGLTKEDARPLVHPFFEEWYDPEREKESVHRIFRRRTETSR